MSVSTSIILRFKNTSRSSYCEKLDSVGNVIRNNNKKKTHECLKPFPSWVRMLLLETRCFRRRRRAALSYKYLYNFDTLLIFQHLPYGTLPTFACILKQFVMYLHVNEPWQTLPNFAFCKIHSSLGHVNLTGANGCLTTWIFMAMKRRVMRWRGMKYSRIDGRAE